MMNHHEHLKKNMVYKTENSLPKLIYLYISHLNMVTIAPPYGEK